MRTRKTRDWMVAKAKRHIYANLGNEHSNVYQTAMKEMRMLIDVCGPKSILSIGNWKGGYR